VQGPEREEFGGFEEQISHQSGWDRVTKVERVMEGEVGQR
jgi:hypothetical protein